MKEKKQFRGKNLFYDRNNRLIYMDPISEKLFVITDSEVKSLYVLQNRVWIALLAAAVLYFYLKDVSRVIAAFGVCYFGLSLAYKKMFLPRLEEATGLTKADISLPPVENAKEEVKPQSVSKILLNSLLAFVVSILFIMNTLDTANMSSLIKTLHYVLSAGTICYGLFNLTLLLKVIKK